MEIINCNPITDLAYYELLEYTSATGQRSDNTEAIQFNAWRNEIHEERHR